MNKLFSHLISWGCIAVIGLTVIALCGFLIDVHWFSELAQNNLRLAVYWETVEQWQWYMLLALTIAYLAIGLFGLYFLHRAFKKIALGELFNLTNSLNIRRFSILLFVQTVTKPIYFALASVFLSLNHPEGEKMLSFSFGSQELTMLGLAMILWVVGDVMVEGCRLQSENRQFV